MSATFVYNLAALATLVPALVHSLRRAAARDTVFWLLVAVAVVGTAAWTLAQTGDAWSTGVSLALWLTVTVSLALFAGLAAITRAGWRLAPLLFPYLFLLAVLATVWHHAPEPGLRGTAPAAWLDLHIAVAVAAYGLLTLASVAALAVFLQERALKAKQPTALTRRLPAVAEAEVLQVRLLAATAVVLALGLLTGMATQYYETGMVLVFSHKILLSFIAFAVVLGLLWVHHRTGVRGRRAARVVLLAYLLLTLAYPGVKFVTDVLLA